MGPGASGAAGVKYALATEGAAQVPGEESGSAGEARGSDIEGVEREGEGDRRRYRMSYAWRRRDMWQKQEVAGRSGRRV